MMISMHSLILTLLLAPAAAQVKVSPSTAASDTIIIAGSITAQPIATTWRAAYTKQFKAKATVDNGGSSDGAKRVCGDTSKGPAVDIATMSCAWKSTVTAVGSDGYTYTSLIGTKPKAFQIDIAIDGITVILKKGSLADTCIKAIGGLKIAQLCWVYSSYTESKLTLFVIQILETHANT
jgi:ABC-type phosphate transport system substrate-binding protein